MMSFAWAVDNDIRRSSSSWEEHIDMISFAWAVDNDIRSSSSSSNSRLSRVRSYASIVNSAIGSSPASSFAAIRTDHDDDDDDDSDFGTFDVYNLFLNGNGTCRVKGIIGDGEFDRIFSSLGLSGPDDFSIPAAAWEQAQAQKARVASPPATTEQPQLDTWQNKKQREVVGIKAVTSTWRRSTQPQTERDPLPDESFEIYNLSPNGNGNGCFKSWQKVQLLGRGTFGCVYEGIADFGFFFAVKEVSVSLLDYRLQNKDAIFQLQQEISLLSQFRHDNIVRYLGTEKDNDKLYIFLELVTIGPLASLYQKCRLWGSHVSTYTRQILSGLKYLHDHNVVHRDIKCANILVDANGSVKLADFGLAKATKLNNVRSCKGYVYWMAPEVVKSRNGVYDELAADIWSLGCTVLEMLTQQPPYSHLDGVQALFRIGRGEPPSVPESLSTSARDFILKCLQADPTNRPTAAQLLHHPFVK